MYLYNNVIFVVIFFLSNLIWSDVSYAQNSYPAEAGKHIFMDGGYVGLIKPDTEDWWARGVFNLDDEYKIMGGFGLNGHGDLLKKYFMGFGRTPWNETSTIYLRPNGNFGVGENYPQVKLDVLGQAACDTSLTVGVHNQAFRGINVHHGENIDWQFLELRNNNGTKLIVDAEGNMGVNTATPAYKIDVCGIGRFSDVLVDAEWCDYVFEDSYALPTLEAEKNHIEEEGHLLGFESEEAMAGQISLEDVTQRQQVKIEEMMLHLIQLNEQVKLLINENERLKKNQKE